MGKQSTSLREFINTYIFPQLSAMCHGLRKQRSTLRDVFVASICFPSDRHVFLREKGRHTIERFCCGFHMLIQMSDIYSSVRKQKTALREFNVAFMYFICQASILVWCSNRLLRESPLLLPYAFTSVRHLFMHEKATHSIEIFRYCIHIQLPTIYFYVKKQQTAFWEFIVAPIYLTIFRTFFLHKKATDSNLWIHCCIDILNNLTDIF